MRIHGAFIDEGPQDWQIIQRHGSAADIALSGVWSVPENSGVTVETVIVRVVEENTNKPIINWQNADTTFEADGLSGSWNYTLKQVPQGGLYRIETKIYAGDYVWGFRGDMRHHIGVGDIYCIIGQSNSTGYGRDHLTDAPELGVHLYRMRGQWDLATHPFADSTDTIYPDNNEGGNTGACPYLSFGKMLKKALHVPIGLMPAALGGSPISTWLTSQDGYLYQNMQKYLAAIDNDFTGFLWYQGCSDAHSQCHPEKYLEEFSELVDNLRRDYGMKPILTTQLNKVTTDYRTQGSDYKRHSFGMIRGAQRDAAHKIPEIYVVPSYDLPTSDEIHNSCSSNLVIGERLAEVALNAVYHVPGYDNAFAPDVKDVRRITDDTVEIFFDHCEHLCVLNVPAAEMPFTCTDEQGMIFPVSMQKTTENSMTVTFERAIGGKAVVNLCPEEIGAMRSVLDQSSYLPALAFYAEQIK